MYLKDEFHFNDEAKQSLYKILKKKWKKYDDVKANNFINNLERHCYLMKKRKKLPSPAQQRDDLQDTVNNFKKCIDQLEKLPHEHWNMWILGEERKFYDLSIYSELDTPQINEEMKKRVEAVKGAKKSLSTLVEMIKQFMNQDKLKVKDGRPEADTLNFVYAIAKLILIELSVKPTTTRDGLFAEIVRISYEALGQPVEYPRKAIKNAVQEVNSDLIPYLLEKEPSRVIN